MRVLIIRHAIAVPHGTRGIPDQARPLTAEGARRFRAAARGLARIVDAPDVLWTSPLPRARRTAEIAARAWGGGVVPTDAPALIEARPADVTRLLARRRGAALVALVGHEPSLSALVAHLLGARDGGRFAFKKGAAVLLELGKGPRSAAKLLWALPPRILRALA
jgi:phosphohistidine phosphatase